MFRISALAFLCSASLAVAADPKVEAALAWASASKFENPKAAAALAWASACKCGPDCLCPDCQCEKNPRGLEWRPAVNDANAGKVIYLVEPGKCTGQGCTPDKIVGGVTVSSGDYQPFDGKKWGKSSKPPIALPKLEADDAARIIATALIGIVSEDFNDCPTGRCPPNMATSTSFYGASFYGGGTGVSSFASADTSTIVVADRRRGPLRRLLSAPFRAIRAARQAARVEFVAAPVEATRYEMTPVATLQPVTRNVPVTRYEWVPITPAKPEAKQPAKPG